VRIGGPAPRQQALVMNTEPRQFEVPADQFKPGLYTCQVNIVDEVASAFTFPRLEMYVRPAAPKGEK